VTIVSEVSKKESLWMFGWHSWKKQIREFPREGILISFLAAALLQIFAGHALLIRLVLKLASQIVITFAPWRLYQTVPGRRFSSAEESLEHLARPRFAGAGQI
jgi:hypothetical protein